MDAVPFVEEALRWLPEESGPDKRKIKPNTAPGDTGQPCAADTGPRPCVLLADDNQDMRAYVKRLLEEHYDVHAVADGEAALAAALASPPDLVLSDVMMPGLDGFKLLQALRKDPKTASVPVILLSARAGEESLVEGIEAGADDYLAKPFSARELLARVKSHLELARVRREAAEMRQLAEDRLQAAGQAEDLKNKNEELTRLNWAMVGRELRMIDLKKEVNELCHKTGQPPRYETDKKD
jgi:DNA-binding response OmpR family regulator